MKYIDLSKLPTSPYSAIINVVALDSNGDIIKAENINIENELTDYPTKEEVENLVEPEFIEFADLIAKAERGELEVGKEYRYPYTLVVLDNDDEYFRYKSAGHYFDIVTRALTPSILCEKVRIMYNENDSYFKDWNANVGAWQVWINMQRPTQVDVCYMPSGEDFINTKGQIYKMIDENGIECNYDFKNMLFKCCVDSDYFDSSAENDFNATIPYNEAVNSGRATEPMWLYTFSSYLTNEEWTKNIFDVSLYDRKYNGDGYKTLENIKINLYFADEGSSCVFKFSIVLDSVYPILNYSYADITISNFSRSAEILFGSSSYNITIVDSKVYCYSSYNCEICDSDCVLKNAQGCKIIQSGNVGLIKSKFCELYESSFIYNYDCDFNKFHNVYGFVDALDFPYYFIEYIFSAFDYSNVISTHHCELTNSYILMFNDCTYIDMSYVGNEEVGLIIDSCSHIVADELLFDFNYEKIDDVFYFNIYNSSNITFGNGNTFNITSIDCEIDECFNINIGNNNYITLYQGAEEDLYGFHNLANVTVGNNTGELFISHCRNVNIGDDNIDIRIVGRDYNIRNITVMNNCELYLSDLTTNDENIGIYDIKLENNCALQLCELDNYKCVNDYNGQIDISQIHIKNGGLFNMFNNIQSQDNVAKLINIIVDGSSVQVASKASVRNLKFINSTSILNLYNDSNKEMKNLVFDNCYLSDVNADNIIDGVLFTYTLQSESEVILNDYLVANYPIQYVINGKTYSLNEIL